MLVERGVPRAVILKCPCGCGDDLTLNLDPRAGRAWRLYRDRAGVTLFPSVWRESGCKSHFIVWHNNVFMCNAPFRDNEPISLELDQSVLLNLANGRWTSFDEIAISLGEIPWTVLAACRRLVVQGVAQEGVGQLQGYFQRLT